MSLRTILITALLGASSVALAQPYDRYPQHEQYVPRDRWTTLATHMQLQGRRSVRVDLNGARLRAVELQATRGGANVYQVGILYSDGSQGSVRVNRSLDARHAPNLRLDIGRKGMRGIEALIVEGDGNLRFRVIGG
jgi:hypothetical protein